MARFAFPRSHCFLVDSVLVAQPGIFNASASTDGEQAARHRGDNALPAETAPHPIDVHVGARLRLGRRLRHLRQQALAEALGVSFQQIQKYENGANRIAASRLYGSAALLKVSIASLYEGLGGSRSEARQGRSPKLRRRRSAPQAVRKGNPPRSSTLLLGERRWRLGLRDRV